MREPGQPIRFYRDNIPNRSDFSTQSILLAEQRHLLRQAKKHRALSRNLGGLLFGLLLHETLSFPSLKYPLVIPAQPSPPGVCSEIWHGAYRREAAGLSPTRVQHVDIALQLFKLLSRLAEFPFRRQALIVGEILCRFRDEGIEIRRGLGLGCR